RRANRPDYPLTLNHESTPTLLPAALTSLLSGVQFLEPLDNIGARTPRGLYAVQHGSSDGSDPPEAVEGPPPGDPGGRRPGHHGSRIGRDQDLRHRRTLRGVPGIDPLLLRVEGPAPRR